jgi:AcrR family transcriptional regulator
VSRIANKETRTYRSELRDEQAEATRVRILDATLRVMAGGLASLSIPAVAREAGVSVPTVYRHFRTKDDLLAATYPHVLRRAGFDQIVAGPGRIGDLRSRVRAIFASIESVDDLARAALASPAAQEARRLSIPRRLEQVVEMLATVQPPLPPADRDRIARLLVVLTSSASLRMWRDLGASADEAADDVEYTITAALAASRKDL